VSGDIELSKIPFPVWEKRTAMSSQILGRNQKSRTGQRPADEYFSGSALAVQHEFTTPPRLVASRAPDAATVSVASSHAATEKNEAGIAGEISTT